MQKISLTIDLSKLDKNRIQTRTYTNKNGEEVTVKEYRMDVVPVREPKVIKEGDTWKMVKSHFVADSQTKEERENKTKTAFLGDGIMFQNTNVPEGFDGVDEQPEYPF